MFMGLLVIDKGTLAADQVPLLIKLSYGGFSERVVTFVHRTQSYGLYSSLRPITARRYTSDIYVLAIVGCND